VWSLIATNGGGPCSPPPATTPRFLNDLIVNEA
jgi:hypothetical protein